MIDNTCAIWDMNVHFDIKRQENILCKIPSDSNARNIIFYREFSNAVLGHAIRTFPGMNDETQSYIFTSGSRLLRTPRPLEINMETDVVFLLTRTPVRFYPWYAKFWTFLLSGEYRSICIIDEISYLINQRYWSRLGIFRNKISSRKFVYRRDGGHRSKHVLPSRP